MNVVKGLVVRISQDAKRDSKHACGLESSISVKESQEIVTELQQAANLIFTKGVEVCGDSCVTVSFANQVKAQQKTIKKLQTIASKLAKGVNKCYVKKKIKQDKKGGYVETVIGQTTKDLNSLIKACGKTTVCSPTARLKKNK